MLDALKSEARKRPIYLATLLLAIITIPFLIAPELDIWMTDLFHDAADGFWLKNLYLPYRLRRLGIVAPRLIIILLVLFLIARLFWPQLKKVFSLAPVLYLIAAAVIGPGAYRQRPVQGLLGARTPHPDRPVRRLIALFRGLGGRRKLPEQLQLCLGRRRHVLLDAGPVAVAAHRLAQAFLLDYRCFRRPCLLQPHPVRRPLSLGHFFSPGPSPHGPWQSSRYS